MTRYDRCNHSDQHRAIINLLLAQSAVLHNAIYKSTFTRHGIWYNNNENQWKNIHLIQRLTETKSTPSHDRRTDEKQAKYLVCINV